MRICITADSTCDIPRAWADSSDIHILPLSIVMGANALRDGEDIAPDDIIRYVSEGNPIPKTAAVNVAEYRAAFERRLQTYDAIIHIGLGSNFSSCYSNACVAAEGLAVYCVDSENLSLGSGMLAMEAAKLRDAGKSAEEIVREVRELIPKVDTTFILNGLEYMRKGGRCSTVAALGANLLKLRPCIELREGRMAVGKKYRGNFERCVRQYLTDHMQDIREYRRVILGHTGVDESLMEVFAEVVREGMGLEHLDVIRVGCSITTHCGDNTVGLFLIR